MQSDGSNASATYNQKGSLDSHIFESPGKKREEEEEDSCEERSTSAIRSGEHEPRMRGSKQEGTKSKEEKKRKGRRHGAL
jgi:hypothetical protein